MNRTKTLAVIWAGVAIAVSGCASQEFVPGAGMSAMDLQPDTARCHAFAKGGDPGFAFSGPAAQNLPAGGAASESTSFDACMRAHGWRLAGDPIPQAAAAPVVIATAPASFVPSVALSQTAANPSEPQQIAAARARLPVGLRLMVMTPALMQTAHLDSLRGVYVFDVMPGGVAAKAGLDPRDVLLTFAGCRLRRLATCSAACRTRRPARSCR